MIVYDVRFPDHHLRLLSHSRTASIDAVIFLCELLTRLARWRASVSGFAGWSF